MRFPEPSRRALGLAALVLGIALAGCAAQPPANSPVPLSTQKATFHTGRVLLTVVDYGGFPLRQARVDVEGINDHKDYFRTAAFTDVFGRVNFAGLPERVRITVYHAETRANYSREFDVPSSGTTDLRMMVETFDY